MSWNPEKTLVFRLIAAGHMARRAVQEPLSANGLEPGDDAILIALSVLSDISAQDLLEATGMDVEDLARRLRLMDQKGLVAASADEIVLTEAGTQLASRLMDVWQDVDELVSASVSAPMLRTMRKSLKRISETLVPGSAVGPDSNNR